MKAVGEVLFVKSSSSHSNFLSEVLFVKSSSSYSNFLSDSRIVIGDFTIQFLSFTFSYSLLVAWQWTCDSHFKAFTANNVRKVFKTLLDGIKILYVAWQNAIHINKHPSKNAYSCASSHKYIELNESLKIKSTYNFILTWSKTHSK